MTTPPAIRRTLLWTALPLAAVALAHAALLAWFAEGEVAAVLFTGGHAVSPGLVLGAALFFTTRLLLHLLLPGLLLAQVVTACGAWARGRVRT